MEDAEALPQVGGMARVVRSTVVAMTGVMHRAMDGLEEEVRAFGSERNVGPGTAEGGGESSGGLGKEKWQAVGVMAAGEWMGQVASGGKFRGQETGVMKDGDSGGVGSFRKEGVRDVKTWGEVAKGLGTQKGMGSNRMYGIEDRSGAGRAQRLNKQRGKKRKGGEVRKS